MCGLAGIFHPSGAGRVEAALLRCITNKLRHRGPDWAGFRVEPGVGLDHRRLTINDPVDGEQPTCNEDGSIAIAFSGKIYNIPDLRGKLQASGHVFRDHCDTDAIIHAWESWGPACQDQWSGQFAFAPWDRNRRTRFLARDHSEKQPFYDATDRISRFVFASEPSALAAVPTLPRTPDPAVIGDFFVLRYVLGPASIVREVRKMPPAHCLLWRAGDAMPEPRRCSTAPLQRVTLPEAEAAERVIGLLPEVTARRLVADVPLGSFLSGGIDSPAVVAFAVCARTTALDTVTTGFDGREDESPDAAAVAARCGTRPHDPAGAPVPMPA